MTPADLAADLRARINPLYATQPGTESYERRLCAEAIEGLIAENDRLRTALKDATKWASKGSQVEVISRAALGETKS